MRIANSQQPMSFQGRLLINEQNKEALKETLGEFNNVFTSRQKEEFMDQLAVIRDKIENTGIDIEISGTPSSESIDDEPKITFKQVGGNNDAELELVPDSSNYYYSTIDTSDISMLASKLLARTADYSEDDSTNTIRTIREFLV